MKDEPPVKSQGQRPNGEQQATLPCAAKRRWHVKAQARRWAKVNGKRFKHKRLRVYHCPHCLGYHTTTANKRALEKSKR